VAISPTYARGALRIQPRAGVSCLRGQRTPSVIDLGNWAILSNQPRVRIAHTAQRPAAAPTGPKTVPASGDSPMSLPQPSTSSAALVTGASAGIGRSIALELAGRGYNLILVARRKPRLEALAQELVQGHGIRAEVLACDLANPTSRGRRACTNNLDRRIARSPLTDSGSRTSQVTYGC